MSFKGREFRSSKYRFNWGLRRRSHLEFFSIVDLKADAGASTAEDAATTTATIASTVVAGATTAGAVAMTAGAGATKTDARSGSQRKVAVKTIDPL